MTKLIIKLDSCATKKLTNIAKSFGKILKVSRFSIELCVECFLSFCLKAISVWEKIGLRSNSFETFYFLAFPKLWYL